MFLVQLKITPSNLLTDNQREQRKAFILESLEKFRVFPSLLDLRARIWAHETSRGLRVRMDRKSLSRIIDDLIREARLKFIDMQIVGRRHDGTPRPVDVSLPIQFQEVFGLLGVKYAYSISSIF